MPKNTQQHAEALVAYQIIDDEPWFVLADVCLVLNIVPVLDADQWDAFTVALDAPPKDNPRLRQLMAKRAPWEKF